MSAMPSAPVIFRVERYSWHGVAQGSAEREESEDATFLHCGQWLVERHEGCVERL